MTSEKLQQLIEAGTESRRLDYKSSCEWNILTFAKDILALSNVQDGGYIIVGVDEKADGSFEPTGVIEEHLKTYNVEQMKDQMSHYADPFVNFTVDFPTDQRGHAYVGITIFEFEEVPVICKKDSRDTRNGVIYTRTRNRRPESAPVSNYADMREIIDLATVKMMRRMESLGYAARPAGPTTNELYDQQLRDLKDE